MITNEDKERHEIQFNFLTEEDSIDLPKRFGFSCFIIVVCLITNCFSCLMKLHGSMEREIQTSKFTQTTLKYEPNMDQIQKEKKIKVLGPWTKHEPKMNQI